MTPRDVQALIGDALQVDRSEVGPRTAAGDLEAWDSMGTMNILLALDRECGLRLAPGETTQLHSVEGVVELLRKAGKLS